MKDDPYAVFRWLRREDRARYVELMHETLTGKVRDLDRAGARLGGVIGAGVRADAERMRSAIREILA